MKGGLIKEKDFKDNQVAEVQKFLDQCSFYVHVINIKDSVAKCGDLSDLWFREFYLEICKQVQVS